LDLITPKASEKKLNLAYHIDDDVPTFLVQDVTRIRQILANLLSNAVKFTESGDITIHVSAPIKQEDQVELEFCVADTGIGIPADRLDRLFLSFSQVSASIARNYGGTGLGLAISKRLSEMMGGTMWVESEINVGSKFKFSLIATVGKKNQTDDKYREYIVDKKFFMLSGSGVYRTHIDQLMSRWGIDQVFSGMVDDLSNVDHFDAAIFDGLEMTNSDIDRLDQLLAKMPYLPVLLLTRWGNRLPEKYANYDVHAITVPIKPMNLYNTMLKALKLIGPNNQTRRLTLDQIYQRMGYEHPLRILLAEDNVVNQKVASGMLKRLGYHADIAGNGLEAIDALSRQRYDVVLMDVQMPEMDGVAATKVIRERWRSEEQPYVIAMTAYAMQGDREKFTAEGMDAYISKPVRLEFLIEALEKVPSRVERG
ncbi:MAG: ATP-binding protein, partial [Chloroflexota bacterium]